MITKVGVNRANVGDVAPERKLEGEGGGVGESQDLRLRENGEWWRRMLEDMRIGNENVMKMVVLFG